MADFGPIWHAAEFNLFHYASYCAAPIAIGIGVASKSKAGFWSSVVVAAVLSFAASWYAVETMWSIRAEHAEQPHEIAVVERVAETGQTNAATIAALRTVLFTVIWCIPGRWVWSLYDNQKLPFQQRRLERNKL